MAILQSITCERVDQSLLNTEFGVARELESESCGKWGHFECYVKIFCGLEKVNMIETLKTLSFYSAFISSNIFNSPNFQSNSHLVSVSMISVPFLIAS